MRESIEDYCLRVGRVHPLAEEPGSTIKALLAELHAVKVSYDNLRAENERLKQLATEAADALDKIYTDRELGFSEQRCNLVARIREATQ
jgi:hypothetical protein